MNALLVAQNLPAIIAGLFLLLGLVAGAGFVLSRLTRYQAAFLAGFAAGEAHARRQPATAAAAPVQPRPDGRPQPQGRYRPTRVNPPTGDAPTQRLDLDRTAQLPAVAGRPDSKRWPR